MWQKLLRWWQSSKSKPDPADLDTQAPIPELDEEGRPSDPEHLRVPFRPWHGELWWPVSPLGGGFEDLRDVGVPDSDQVISGLEQDTQLDLEDRDVNAGLFSSPQLEENRPACLFCTSPLAAGDQGLDEGEEFFDEYQYDERD